MICSFVLKKTGLFDIIRTVHMYAEIGISFRRVQSKIAPQILQRRCRNARQQRMPRGKQNIAQQRPIQVNSVSNIPTYESSSYSRMN